VVEMARLSLLLSVVNSSRPAGVVIVVLILPFPLAANNVFVLTALLGVVLSWFLSMRVY
jgi:hypothetical protein